MRIVNEFYQALAGGRSTRQRLAERTQATGWWRVPQPEETAASRARAL